MLQILVLYKGKFDIKFYTFNLPNIWLMEGGCFMKLNKKTIWVGLSEKNKNKNKDKEKDKGGLKERPRGSDRVEL